MQKGKYITFFSGKKEHMLDKSEISYVTAGENHKKQIHTAQGDVYEVRLSMTALEDILGGGFVQVRRGTLVNAAQIKSITDGVNLKNGETLKFAQRQKRRIIDDVLGKTAMTP